MNPRLGWLSWCWSMVVVMDHCVTMVDYCALVVEYCVTIVLLLWTIGLLLVVLLLCYYWVRYPCDWVDYPCGYYWLLLDFGPCEWDSSPRLTRDYWLLTYGVTWLMVGSFWLGGWCWDVLLCWFLWVLWIVRLIPCHSHEFGCSLLDYVQLVSRLWLVMHYAFVIGYWLYSTESWFMIRSAYCCWVSVLNYWTVRWCLYSIWVCKPIYKLCISILPCGCEWWLLSSLLLMVLRVFSRFALKSMRERDRDTPVRGGLDSGYVCRFMLWPVCHLRCCILWFSYWMSWDIPNDYRLYSSVLYD